ncbi:MAG: helix-turn-helix domain-containing protein [Pseudonocardiaceae bacterium]
MRTARGLTLAAVARQATCSVALLSYVESGGRAVQPWLACALDRIYETGSVVASLTRGAEGTPQGSSAPGVPRTDVFVVQLPQGGVAMLLSRRHVLAALGVGIASGGLQEEFERALDSVELSNGCLQFFDDAFHGFREAARFLPPAQLVDGMIGDVAILDGLRRRAADEDPDRRRYGVLQARYAELLS